MYKKIFVLLTITLITSITFNIFNGLEEDGNNFETKNMLLELSEEERKFAESKEKITIGASSDFYPLVSFNEGSAEGLLVDYLNIVGEELGLTIEFKAISSNASKEELEKEKIDGVFAITNTDTFENQAMTNAIIEVKGRVVFSNEIKIENLENLSGVKIAVAKNYSEWETDVLEGTNADILYYDNIEEAFDLLTQGEINGIVGTENAIFTYRRELNLEDSTYLYNDYIFEEEISILSESKDVIYGILNKGLYYINKEKVVPELSLKWTGVSYEFVESSKVEGNTVIMVILISGILFIFYLFYDSNKSLYIELEDRLEQITSNQNEMELTFDSISYMLAKINSASKVIAINKAFETKTKVFRGEAVGQNIFTLLGISEDKQEELKAETKIAIEKGSDFKKEVIIGRKLYELRISSIDSHQDEEGKALLIVIDITETKSTERQMIQNNKMIAIGQLAAGVAHEIRNPLGIIRNYCYILKTDNLENEEVKEKAIATIEKSVNKSNAIIENLLNFSKASAGKLEEINLCEHIGGFLALQEKEIESKGIKIEYICNIENSQSIIIEALDIILINLISNAVEAMEARGASGELSILCDENKESVSIRIGDNGSGIEEEDLEEIFNPFFTTKLERKGNGLGLYLVYNEVQKLEGEITVESKVGVGTIFKLILPKR